MTKGNETGWRKVGRFGSDVFSSLSLAEGLDYRRTIHSSVTKVLRLWIEQRPSKHGGK